jgi:hypothetical protein
MRTSFRADRRTLFVAFLTVMVALSGTTCGTATAFEIQGAITDGVKVRVYDARTGKPISGISDVVVGEKYGLEVWRSTGDASIHEFVYGGEVKGLEPALPPVALEPGKTYYVAVSGWIGGWVGRSQTYGTCSFSVLEDGTVAPEENCGPRN